MARATTSARLAVFEVDKAGLAQILERYGRSRAVLELIQNAWDERVTRVAVRLEPIDGAPGWHRLVVSDDSPDGFADLSHAYTLFAASHKKDRAELRGRFNLGEKLVIALCRTATIETTTGTVTFTEEGREHSAWTTTSGSIFSGEIRMNRDEARRCERDFHRLIGPADVITTFNGQELAARERVKAFTATLQTEVADDDGRLTRRQRETEVHLYEPLDGEKAALYELGIPVQPTGDRWHVDVQQKVPLSIDRESVPPSFLRAVRAEVLNHAAEKLTDDDAAASWVSRGLEDKRITAEAVGTSLDRRYGARRVIHDPSDPEANKLAVAAGYTVVPSRGLSREALENVRQHDALPPAGRVTPSSTAVINRHHAGGEPLTLVDEDKWTIDQRQLVGWAMALHDKLFREVLHVQITADITEPYAATYAPAAWGGMATLTFNVGRLGHSWFREIGSRQLELIVHEFAHHDEIDHLDHRFADAIGRLGARIVSLALTDPAFFADTRLTR